MLQKIILIFLAGGVGTLARYGLAALVQKFAGSGFPWGTVAVNMLGCFLFGVLWSLAGQRLVISAEARTVILIGFMGAFTTFSTFISETTRMMAASQMLGACGNLLLQNVLGIAVFLLGSALGRIL